jgi:hypothetical protein
MMKMEIHLAVLVLMLEISLRSENAVESQPDELYLPPLAIRYTYKCILIRSTFVTVLLTHESSIEFV